jgi:hypothetical protein
MSLPKANDKIFTDKIYLEIRLDGARSFIEEQLVIVAKCILIMDIL